MIIYNLCHFECQIFSSVLSYFYSHLLNHTKCKMIMYKYSRNEGTEKIEKDQKKSTKRSNSWNFGISETKTRWLKFAQFETVFRNHRSNIAKR